MKNSTNKVNETNIKAIENKTAIYKELAREFEVAAEKIANENSFMFIEKMKMEVVNHAHVAIKADCEYTAYVEAHAAEEYLNQMNERI